MNIPQNLQSISILILMLFSALGLAETPYMVAPPTIPSMSDVPIARPLAPTIPPMADVPVALPLAPTIPPMADVPVALPLAPVPLPVEPVAPLLPTSYSMEINCLISKMEPNSFKITDGREASGAKQWATSCSINSLLEKAQEEAEACREQAAHDCEMFGGIYSEESDGPQTKGWSPGNMRNVVVTVFGVSKVVNAYPSACFAMSTKKAKCTFEH